MAQTVRTAVDLASAAPPPSSSASRTRMFTSSLFGFFWVTINAFYAAPHVARWIAGADQGAMHDWILSLIEQWLMKNDFRPVVGHPFTLRATPGPHWNGVTDCEVLIVEPNQRLSYGWNASGEEAVVGFKTVVTWTLTPTKGGTRVRMEQSGFRPEEEASYQGASYGWQRFFGVLEQVVAGLN